MKYLITLLLFIVLQFDDGLFATLESNETGVGQQRSARVHRVSEFPVNEDSNEKNTKNEESLKETLPFNSQKIFQTFSKKIQSALPDLNNLIQREAQLFKELPDNVKLKNVDLAVNEMMNTASSAAASKSTSKNAKHLDNNFLNSPEELDIYHQDGQDDGKQTKSRSSFSQIESTNDLELKTVKNVAQYLDNVLMEIQNHINYVRNVFDKLCRKHRSTTRSNTSNMEKFASTNQPKKVSIL